MGNKDIIIKVFMVLITLTFILLFIMILKLIITFDLFQTFNMVYIYTIYFIVFLLWLDKSYRFSLSMIVIYYMFFQATGLPLAYIINPQYVLLRLDRSKMLYGIYMDRYIALSLLGLTCIILVFLCSKSKNKSNYKTVSYNADNQTNAYYQIGITLLLLFTVYMFFNYLIGNIPIGNYVAYKAWAGSNRIGNYLQMGYWLSSILICSTATKEKIKISTVIFLIPSTILILTGNRNDMLFPFLIGFAIYVYRYKTVPRIALLLAILAIFVISPLIVGLRTGGIIFESISYNIAISLAEIGSQLTPVSHMFMWLDSGEDYAWGLTYLYGTIGLLFGFIFPELRYIIENSRYWILRRLPGQAFAMTAEVYFNFRVIGVIIIYSLIGYYFMKNEINKTSGNGLVIYGSIVFILLFLVRNSFGYSIVYIIIFIFAYLLEKILRRILLINRKVYKWK